jgi:deoxyribonuclease-4
MYAAGYNIATAEGYHATIDQVITLVGRDRIKAFHLNDSKGTLGSHLDRHAPIGEGEIGLEGFRALVNDARFFQTPMILETPKGKDASDDIRNLTTLRGLRTSNNPPVLNDKEQPPRR